jgi:hypothetical protein
VRKIKGDERCLDSQLLHSFQEVCRIERDVEWHRVVSGWENGVVGGLHSVYNEMVGYFHPLVLLFRYSNGCCMIKQLVRQAIANVVPIHIVGRRCDCHEQRKREQKKSRMIEAEAT